MDIKTDDHLLFLKEDCPLLNENELGSNDVNTMNTNINLGQRTTTNDTGNLNGTGNINHTTLNQSNNLNMDIDNFNYNFNNGFEFNKDSISDKSSPSTNNSQIMNVEQLIFHPENTSSIDQSQHSQYIDHNLHDLNQTNLNNNNLNYNQDKYNTINNSSNNINPDNQHASNQVELFSFQQMTKSDHSNSVTSEKEKGKKSKRQILDDQDAILIAKDDSELSETELQLKRKAQNRAAQRAFRERKETKLKDLELKLNKSEEEKQQLLDQLEAIRKNNLNVLAENEALKHGTSGRQPHYDNFSKDFAFPKNEKQFIDGILYGTNHQFKYESRKQIYKSPETGSKVLALGAVWDYLLYRIEHENLNVDIVEVMDRLKGNEKCHGYGPAYPIDLIDQVLDCCADS